MALAEPLPTGEEQDAPATADREVILGYPTLRSHILHKVKRETLPKVGLLIVFVTIFLAIFGPLIVPFNTTAATNLVTKAVIAAPRIDVSIALLATALALIVGSAIGLFATFYGGWLGALAIRATDTLQAFPALILAIIVVVLTGHGIGNIIVVIAVLNMPLYARLMRSEVLRIRDRAFVEAARASGLSDFAIAWRQVLPNATAPIVAQMSVTIGWAILATAGLSFLGAGVVPPTPEWGSMISTGSSGIILGQWWPSVFPGIAMALTVFGFAVVADTIQTALGREG